MKPPDTICPQCDGPVTQSGRGRPRRFCTPESGVKFANDQKPRKYGNQAGYDAKRHMLTDLDTQAMIATCSKCGPRVRVYSAGTGEHRYQCINRAKTHKRKPHVRRLNRELSWQRRKIRLTVEEYDGLIQSQVGLCASCEVQLDDSSHVDHDHSREPATIENGGIRGILCHPCNRAAGLLADDPARLRAVANYLESRQPALAREA